MVQEVKTHLLVECLFSNDNHTYNNMQNKYITYLRKHIAHMKKYMRLKLMMLM